MSRPGTGGRLTAVDLFAGCGGMGLGLQQAGFMSVFVNELNGDAMGTYLRNRSASEPHLFDPEFHCADIKDLVSDRLRITRLQAAMRTSFGIRSEDLDLVCGGPPCQGFSGIGHRRSYSVEREQLPSNHLYQDMAYVISRLRPKCFLFENVRGLVNARWNVSGAKGEVLSSVLDAFGSIPGYTVACDLVFARDYGVPQNRPRLLIVGILNDLGRLPPGLATGRMDAVARGFLPGPTGRPAPGIQELLGDLEDPDYENGGSTSRYRCRPLTTVQRKLRTQPNGVISGRGELFTEQEYSKHTDRVRRKFRAMLASPDGSIPEEYRTKKFAQRVLPRHWGADGPNITAASLPDDYVHFSQPRCLTVREWARLQMFPDWYQFEGKRTTGGLRRAGNPREGIFDRELPKYTQIGNAVPVTLALHLGLHLRSLITGRTSKAPP